MGLMTQVGLEFIARNLANRQISSFNRSIQRMGRQMLAMAGMGGGLYAVKRGFDYVVKSALEQERVERELTAAVQGSIAVYKSYAAEMQKLTIYGDEQILTQMAYAKNLGVTTDKLQEATTAAIGLAARYRIDLAAAMMLVGRASQGQTQMLTRYGIVIDQNLSTQEKFNEILRIGAESFGLAKAEAGTAAGSIQQMNNAISDTAETLGDVMLPAIKDLSTESAKFLQENSAALKRYVSDFVEGVSMMVEYQKNLLKWTPQGLMYRGYKALTGKKETLPAEPTAIASPPGEDPWAPLNKRIELLKNQQASALEIGKKYLPALQREIEITGRIGEAHYHAAKMVDFENAIRKAGIENTTFATIVTEKYMQKLKELEGAQRLAKIADSIGDAFGNAFEKMIFEAEKFGDVFKSLMQEVAMAVVRHAVIQPFAIGISGAVGEMFGLDTTAAEVPSLQSGGTVGRGGLFNLHAGEKVMPASEPGGWTIVVNNQGLPVKPNGAPVINGREIVIGIVQKDYADHGPMYDLINQGGP